MATIGVDGEGILNPIMLAAQQKAAAQTAAALTAQITPYAKTMYADLNDGNYADAWKQALATAPLYNTTYNSPTTDPLLLALESGPGLQAFDPSKKWSANDITQFYAAMAANPVMQGITTKSPIDGQTESLGQNPYGLWGDPSKVAVNDSNANIGTAGDNSAPDVERFVGARPSQGFLSKWGLPIVAVIAAIVAPYAAPAIAAGLAAATGVSAAVATVAAGAIYGAAAGAIGGAISGGNIGEDALLGGVTGGIGASPIGSSISSGVNSVTGLGTTGIGGVVDAGISGAAKGALTGAVTGEITGQGALSGAEQGAEGGAIAGAGSSAVSQVAGSLGGAPGTGLSTPGSGIGSTSISQDIGLAAKGIGAGLTAANQEAGAVGKNTAAVNTGAASTLLNGQTAQSTSGVNQVASLSPNLGAAQQTSNTNIIKANTTPISNTLISSTTPVSEGLIWGSGGAQPSANSVSPTIASESSLGATNNGLADTYTPYSAWGSGQTGFNVNAPDEANSSNQLATSSNPLGNQVGNTTPQLQTSQIINNALTSYINNPNVPATANTQPISANTILAYTK